MNSELSELENDNQTLPEPAGDPPKKGGTSLALLALLLSLCAILGTAWMWWQDSSARGEVEQRAIAELSRLESTDNELSLKLNQLRNEMDAALAADDGEAMDALNRRLATDRNKVAELERTIDDQLAVSRSLQAAAEAMQGRLVAAEAALGGMSSRELDAGGELDLAEVDYLLRLANERLKLFADPQAADQALEVADMHLAAIDNPIYLGVRRDIAAVRQSLDGLALPDALEVANQLDALQASVASLPFPRDEPPAVTAAESAGDGWWERIKRSFSGLITVRRSTEQENERISMEDKDFVRQRVWMQLEVAHLAMMRHEQASFVHALERARETITSWFDTEDAATQAMLESLGELQSVEVDLEVPDITAPWTTLRAVRAGQPRPVALPMPEQAPEPEIEPEIEPETGQEQGDSEE